MLMSRKYVSGSQVEVPNRAVGGPHVRGSGCLCWMFEGIFCLDQCQILISSSSFHGVDATENSIEGVAIRGGIKGRWDEAAAGVVVGLEISSARFEETGHFQAYTWACTIKRDGFSGRLDARLGHRRPSELIAC